MKRIESLQALRAIAFIAIFLSHCDVIATGPMGVSIFLVLSGFLLIHSAEKRKGTLMTGFAENIRFATSKMKKLYPLHILTLLAMILFMLVSSEKQEYWVPKAVMNALLLQAWFPSESWYLTFNKASWYLSVSAFTYFVFPFFYSIIQEKNRRALIYIGGGTALIIVLLSFLLNLIENGIDSGLTKWLTYIFPVYRCWDMFMGMLLGKVFFQTKHRKTNKWTPTLLEIILLILWTIQIYLYRRGYMIPNAFRFSVFWLPTSLLSVYVFAQKGGAITKLLTNRALVFVGNISGIAFLVHQIIIGVAKMASKNTWIIALSAFAATLVVSYFYQTVEKRVRGFVHAHRDA